ncbi:cation:proton antiporter [Rhizobium halophytocola]|uniref:Kef-type K+ transport system membrane component KefB/nucleotide-binding universal stress UspA family protein n=1 Tax=Rhizobium halophytocola TaxID=735519 RepID=A0ABS4DV18_9HYPH|nr:cation:proton antiporter [Rhizobium halophytocola]MBP1849531.1 Kef-type K+ transport system membrane component KefB/nucleotide-binding universal stress UspA family protein [Rhizobium halophytocola]
MPQIAKSWSFRLSLLLVLPLILASTALAANAPKAEGPSEALFLIQVIILVVVGRLLGEAMVRIGQPSIMGQIIGGILLGPSVFGLIWPDMQLSLFPTDVAQKSMTNAVGQLGILFLLLLAGMETDLGLAIRLRRAAAGVSLTGIAIPFALGFTLGELIPADYIPDPDKRLVTALFLGTALSISSVKIVASVVREMDFMRRNIGQLIVASAIIDDTVGWVIIAVTFSLAEKGAVDLPTLARSVIGTLAFMAFSFTIGRRIVFEIIRWTNDRFKSDLPVLSAIIAIMGGMAIITDLIGVHTVLGAFVAGILVGESPILTRQIDMQLRALTTALFMPVFFGLTGLQTDLSVLSDMPTLIFAGVVILIASLGKFGGAFAAAKIGGYSRAEALALGCGMNARGSTEVIVATIGLSVGVLDERLFSVIVAMAVITTMAMPPTLRWALKRLPMREDEKSRLEREKFEETSYMSRFERILLAGDRSESSDLAARIAGHFAALRKMPISVLDVTGNPEDEEQVEKSDERAAKMVEAVNRAATRVVENAEGEADVKAADIHVTVRSKEGKLIDLLGEDSEKGHDLLFAGVEPTAARGGGFDKRLTEMSTAFAGTTAIISSRGTMPKDGKALKILVPISGTTRSTRAAEFAAVLAKAANCEIAALYITEPQAARSRPRLSDVTDVHREAFKKIDEIAGFYELEIEKIVQSSGSPELSILKRARLKGFNLIVMGVSRREGDRLSYGTIADTLLESSDRSIVFIETE